MIKWLSQNTNQASIKASETSKVRLEVQDKRDRNIS